MMDSVITSLKICSFIVKWINTDYNKEREEGRKQVMSEQNNLYKYILNSLNIGPIIYVDDQHITRYMNGAAKAGMPECAGHDIMDRSVLSYHREESRQKILSYYEEMKQGKLSEVLVRKKAKAQIYMQSVKDDEGRVIGYLERYGCPKNEGSEQVLIENHYQKAFAYYDYFHTCQDEIGFYNKIIPQNAKVLNLFARTGEISLSLALRGNDVLGLEMSQELLSVFNQKIVNKLDELREKGRIRKMMKGLLEYSFKETFDFIIFSSKGFQTLFSDKSRLEVLRTA